jgi:hypothetical protein
LCCFCLHKTEYQQIRAGGAKLPWAQGRKIPKYRPEGGRFEGADFVSFCGKMLKKSYILNFIIVAKFNI